MKVLVACEESQAVTTELRKLGHEAYSCDIQECSGGHPEWHIVGDVLPLLNGNCKFRVQDVNEGVKTIWDKWDMILAFPPCTHLSVSGARHFEKKREDGRQREGIEFFCKFLEADCDKIAIENPVNIISGDYVREWFPDLAEKYGLPLKPTQHIQPYEYGDKARKKTCLWLKGLKPLQPTNVVEPELVTYTRKDGRKTTFSANFCSGYKQDERSKHRSKTYPGVAKAMAEQWTTKKSKMKVLDLFAGTRSVSKVFEERGHEIFTIDWNREFENISIYADIRQITAQDIIEKFGRPDVIWASPDCSTFSVASISKHRRKNPQNGSLEPITEYAKFCDEVDKHVLELIKELNPKFYFIENPRGGMRKMTWMQDLPRYTVTYCQYGDTRMNPTDIWTNHPNPRFKPPCKNGDKCHEPAPRGSATGTQKLKGSKARSVIPRELCEHVANICEEYI